MKLLQIKNKYIGLLLFGGCCAIISCNNSNMSEEVVDTVPVETIEEVEPIEEESPLDLFFKDALQRKLYYSDVLSNELCKDEIICNYGTEFYDVVVKLSEVEEPVFYEEDHYVVSGWRQGECYYTGSNLNYYPYNDNIEIELRYDGNVLSPNNARQQIAKLECISLEDFHNSYRNTVNGEKYPKGKYYYIKAKLNKIDKNMGGFKYCIEAFDCDFIIINCYAYLNTDDETFTFHDYPLKCIFYGKYDKNENDKYYFSDCELIKIL